MRNNIKVGFFDSGVGGLSVLKEAFKRLKGYDFVYIGDTQRMPYGVRTPEEVEQFTIECIDYISKIGIDSCVIACNTATAYGLEKAKKTFDFPVVGVVEAACQFASEATNNNNVLLLATEGTVKSGAYRDCIKSLNPQIELVELGCPEYVMAIEAGHLNDDVIKGVIEKYLDMVKDFNYDTIILGCTHFPLAKDVLLKIFEERNQIINIVDPAQKTLENLIEIKNYKTNIEESIVDFYVTGEVEKFKETACEALNLKDKKVAFNKAYIVKGETK